MTSVDRSILQIQVGEELPALRIPITRTMIVATAIASRDYQDVHHDPELAKGRGSQDVFMNILTSNGLVERYVRSWAGPTARLKTLKIRLGAPNYPGDEMLLSAKVESSDPSTGCVSLAVSGNNSLGTHVAGMVVLQFPSTSPASGVV